MFDVTEHPVLEANETPDSEKESGDELTDVRRDVKVVLQAGYYADVDEKIQPHEDGETNRLDTGLAATRVVFKHPLFIDDEKKKMRDQTRGDERRHIFPLGKFVEQKIADVGAPKQDVAGKLQFDKFDRRLDQRLFLCSIHVLLILAEA